MTCKSVGEANPDIAGTGVRLPSFTTTEADIQIADLDRVYHPIIDCSNCVRIHMDFVFCDPESMGRSRPGA